MCKTYHWAGRGGEGGRKLLLTLAPERGKFTYTQLHKKWMPQSTPWGWPGLQMTELVQWSVFQVMPKWQTKTRNEIPIRFSKWCEREKRKLKLMSVFQSDAKTKNEIQSSKPFFKVRRKRKTKSKFQICFSMPCENEKWIWHLNSFFPCHRKTVGTKVHAFKWSTAEVDSLDHIQNRILRTHDPRRFFTTDPKSMNRCQR